MHKKYFLLLSAVLLLIHEVQGSSSRNKRNSEQKSTTNQSSAHHNFGIVFGLGVLGFFGYQYATTPTHLDIQVLDLAINQGNFSQNFAWGVASASSQNEEDSLNNSWSPAYLASKNQSNLASPGAACKSWCQWQDDIDKLVYLGVSSYRLSIEWSRVQPTADRFDQSAIDHYVQICKALVAHNITPMICLHHYSDPAWFLEMGGFSQEKNIPLFTKFCQKIYFALRPYVAQWIVISQPCAYALKGYSQAMQPPFIKDGHMAEMVMLNLFKAHIQVYDMMHNSYDQKNIGLQPYVGLCHQITQMQAYTPYSPLDHAVATAADRMYNKSLLRFFKTGHFRCLKPLIDIAYIPNAPQKFDFFALSYYCPKSFTRTKAIAPKSASTHLTADLSRVIDKQGMYDAIFQASQLGKPVIVVESGINPTDDNQRILLLNSYLSAISQAIADGYDVRGYYHWTLMDNYEWAQPFDYSHFGLYKNRVINVAGDLHPDYKNHDAMLKPSGKYYKNIMVKQSQKS
jgi:beta-glucosidase